MKRKKLISNTLAYVFLSLGAVIMLLPFIWMISTSLKPQNEVFTFPPTLFGSEIVFSNYSRISARFPFGRFFLNSVYIAFFCVLAQILTSSLAGFAFARLKFKGREALFTLYLATMMIPGQVTIIPTFLIMKNLGLINTHAALIIPQLVTAFGTFLMRQFFMTVPQSLEDAGKIDGCTPFGNYWHIFLPMSKPTIATLGIFVFMGVWNDYFRPLIFINSVDLMTLPLGLSMMQGLYTTDWTVLMAGTFISILPVIIIFLLAQDLFIKGVMLSGIKE